MWAALLKLIPGKDWLYCGIIALLLGLGTYEYFHILHKGENEVVDADKKTALVAQAKDKQIELLTQQALDKTGEIYEKAVAVPTVADIGIVCRNPSASGTNPTSPQSQPNTFISTVHGNPGPYDPSGELLTILRDGDDQINGLIDTVNELLDYIDKLSKVH